MSTVIHPTAIVDPAARLGAGVDVGPFVIIGPQVTVGDGCRLEARVTLERNVRLGAGVRVGIGSVLGGAPQDVKFGGEETWVEVGERTVIREYSTVNWGTAATGMTRVGGGCFLMTYVHIAHDCQRTSSLVPCLRTRQVPSRPKTYTLPLAATGEA